MTATCAQASNTCSTFSSASATSQGTASLSGGGVAGIIIAVLIISFAVAFFAAPYYGYAVKFRWYDGDNNLTTFGIYVVHVSKTTPEPGQNDEPRLTEQYDRESQQFSSVNSTINPLSARLPAPQVGSLTPDIRTTVNPMSQVSPSHGLSDNNL